MLVWFDYIRFHNKILWVPYAENNLVFDIINIKFTFVPFQTRNKWLYKKLRFWNVSYNNSNTWSYNFRIIMRLLNAKYPLFHSRFLYFTFLLIYFIFHDFKNDVINVDITLNFSICLSNRLYSNLFIKNCILNVHCKIPPDTLLSIVVSCELIDIATFLLIYCLHCNWI